MTKNRLEAFSAGVLAIIITIMVLEMHAPRTADLARLLATHHGQDSTLSKALGSDRKGRISIAIYAAAIPLAFFSPRLAYALYALVALIWLYPDRRFEVALTRA